MPLRFPARLAVLSALFVAAPVAAQIELSAGPLDPTMAAVPPKPAPASPQLRMSAGILKNRLLFGREIDDVAEWTALINANAAAAADAAPTERSLLSAGWEQALATQVAAFLTDRAKTELLASASDQLRTGMCSPAEPRQSRRGSNQGARAGGAESGGGAAGDGAAGNAAATLRPAEVLKSTCSLALTSNPYTVPMAWTTYKAAFEQDVAMIPDRLLGSMLRNDDTQVKAFRDLALTGVSLIRELEDGEDPLLVLGSLRNYAGSGTACKDDVLCVGVRALGVAVNVLEPLLDAPDPGSNATRRSGDPDYLDEAFTEFRTGINKIQGLNWSPTTDEAARVRTALQRAGHILGQIQTWGKEAESDTTSGTFNRYVDATIRLMALLPELIPSKDLYDNSRHLRSALTLVDRANVAVAHIRNKEYSDAFVVVTQLASDPAYTGYMRFELPTWYRQYVPFVAEIASANTPEAFNGALNAAVAPMGSYRAKREAGFHWGINAYAGMQGGVEELRGANLPESVEDLESGHFGLALPIGLELGYGFGSISVGVLGTLVDLGNAASFRTGEDDTRQEGEADGASVGEEPEHGLRQLLSPGVFGVIGIGRRFPVSLGFGGSWVQDLREVENAAGESQNASTFRWSLFLGIDLPLIRF